MKPDSKTDFYEPKDSQPKPKDRWNISVVTTPEITERFNYVKSYFGLSTNSSVIEFLISNYYHALTDSDA